MDKGLTVTKWKFGVKKKTHYWAFVVRGQKSGPNPVEVNNFFCFTR